MIIWFCSVVQSFAVPIVYSAVTSHFSIMMIWFCSVVHCWHSSTNFSFVGFHSSIMITLCCSVLQWAFFDFFSPLKISSHSSIMNILCCRSKQVGTPRLFPQDSVLIPLLFSFRVAVSYSWYAKNIFCLVNSLLIVNRTFSSKQTFEILSTPTEAHTYRYLWM